MAEQSFFVLFYFFHVLLSVDGSMIGEGTLINGLVSSTNQMDTKCYIQKIYFFVSTDTKMGIGKILSISFLISLDIKKNNFLSADTFLGISCKVDTNKKHR